MSTTEAIIFSILNRDNIIHLESIFQKLFQQFDSISERRAFIQNVGIDNYFIDSLDFKLPPQQFVSILVADLKNYRVSRQNPYYHPLLLITHFVTNQPRKKFSYLEEGDIQYLEVLHKMGNLQIQKILQNQPPETIKINNQSLDNYLNTIEKNLKNQGALDIQKNLQSQDGNFEFELIGKITDFELPFGAFNMRGDAFFILDYLPSINTKALRQYSTQCLEYAKDRATSSVGTQIYNFRVPCNICFSIAVVNDLDPEIQTKIRQENPFDDNVDLLWYEVPIVYCLDESTLYFYDQPSSFWEQFKGEIAWKRLREVIKTTLIPSSTPNNPSPIPPIPDTKPPSSTIDILIITALKDELDALKNCDNQSGNTWQELKDNSGYPYYKTTLPNKNGKKLNILAARPVEMGENYANNLATRLVAELKPHCLAMTGVCAGNKEEVFLGDVIVANRVFKLDYGKLVAHYESIDNQQIRTEEIFHDIRTYNLKHKWEFPIQNFSQDWLNTIQTPRPKSYLHQESWLLNKLYDYQQQPYKYLAPQHHPEKIKECPDWKEVIQRLRKQESLKTDSLELTKKALKEIQNERLEYLAEQHYKDPLNPQIHIGVIATTSKVQKDPKLFQRIEKMQRKILGVEMEGAAIGAVAEIQEIPIIIVKGVQDYADYDKNDQFREYAAEVSARFLLAFFTTIEINS
ncbi:hypothetical protein [Okeania sp. SIO2B3]|uniref:phosphorylase family protein n=1 Tax=Okeania sp. SIO2B3 TaxID=2607784 RepID=UPI0013BED89A|nr:hypothetical protein [Okeania sp. SIO2B3]NET40705.1 5'-methylthioadenosine/S-adenosylhomocysteine nucleosidase [Okeania sp. SIO2B3]